MPECTAKRATVITQSDRLQVLETRNFSRLYSRISPRDAPAGSSPAPNSLLALCQLALISGRNPLPYPPKISNRKSQIANFRRHRRLSCHGRSICRSVPGLALYFTQEETFGILPDQGVPFSYWRLANLKVGFTAQVHAHVGRTRKPEHSITRQLNSKSSVRARWRQSFPFNTVPQWPKAQISICLARTLQSFQIGASFAIVSPPSLTFAF